MASRLASISVRVVMVILILVASPILCRDRAPAQDVETPPQSRHAPTDTSVKGPQERAPEQIAVTAETLFRLAQDRAGSACSRNDLEDVVKIYQELLQLVDTDPGRERIGETFLQLGRYNLYLNNYEEAEAFLNRSLQSFTSVGDSNGKARVLAVHVVLNMRMNRLQPAAELFDQALTTWGIERDLKSQASGLTYMATIFQEAENFQRTVDCSEKQSPNSGRKDKTAILIEFVGDFVKRLRSNGMHEKAEYVGEKSLVSAREKKNERWEAAALGHLAGVYKNQGQYDRAFVRYLKAVKIYEVLKDGPKQTGVMNAMGRLLVVQGKNREAKEMHEKALAVARAGGDAKGEAVSLGGLGSVFQTMGEYSNAAECHEKSLEIVRKLGDVRAESYTLDHIGAIHQIRGEYAEAARYFEESLAIRRTMGHLRGEAAGLNKLGGLYQSWGHLGKALKYLEESLEITRKTGDVRGEAAGLNNLGKVCLAWGQYDKAMEYFEKSLEITGKIGDVKGEAAGLNNLGKVYLAWGQYDKAMKCYDKSLKIARKTGDVKAEAASLNNLGRVRQSWGQYDKALECYRKSLEISRRIGDVKAEAASLRSLGIVSAALSRQEEAAQFYREVLAIEKRLGISTSLTSALLAQLYMDMGDIEKAEVFAQESNKPIPLGRLLLLKSDFQGAKKIYEDLLKKAEEGRHRANQFVSYTGLGMALEGLGRYDEAAENYRRAIKLTEKGRERLSSEDRDAYFDVRVRGVSRTAPYEGMARVLVMMNQQERAFRVSELAKARAFAEAVLRKPSKSPLNVPPEVAAKSLQLADRMAELEARRDKALQYGDKELLEYLESQIRQVEGVIRDYRKSLREKFPLYSATMYPTKALPLKRSAVKENEWILSYDATDLGLLVYLAHGKQIVRAVLRPVRKAAIEDLVRKFRTPLVLEATDDYRQKMDKLRSFDFLSGKALADLLLGDLLADLPLGVPVIVIPDDSLGDLPFEMLVLNQGGKIEEKDFIPHAADAEFFGDRNPVSYYQSVTALTLTRTFGTDQIPGNKLLVIADPVTDPYDERITAEAISKLATAKETPRGDSAVGLLGGGAELAAARLIQTKELAEHLVKINNSHEMLMGFDASKRKFLREVGPRLSEFKHIVFATHGFYGSNDQSITEPVLFLSLFPQGTDGLLRMSEVMELKLNADLVALTACQSGLGRKVAGEGIMGMGRAFQYAGARSVLMSLWSVQATASTRLVESFYAKLMEGKPKLEALTLARNEIRKNGYDHPFFWAGLILAGEID